MKDTVPCTYVIQDLNNDEVTGTFYQQELHQAKWKDELRMNLELKR